MKESTQKQLEVIVTRYGWVPQYALKNMRMLLLLLFAALSGFLVYRINVLVNNESAPVATEQSVATNPSTSTLSPSISKTPNQSVLSTFNELYVQEVELDSEFDNSRDNPF